VKTRARERRKKTRAGTTLYILLFPLAAKGGRE